MALPVVVYLYVAGRWAMGRQSLMTKGSRPVRNLLPLVGYDTDETGRWRRMF